MILLKTANKIKLWFTVLVLPINRSNPICNIKTPEAIDKLPSKTEKKLGKTVRNMSDNIPAEISV